MTKELFGYDSYGNAVNIYTLKNENCTLKLMDRGASVVSFEVFGTDIIGGFDSVEGYLADDSHQGGTIGRVANRVSCASFTMDGKIYTLPKNDGNNCLHGGEGFDKRMWNVTKHSDDNIVFSYLSEDGEEGFPGRLEVAVSYTLSGTDLIIDYTAIPSSKTPISLTNHSYFNLDGFGKDIKKHKLILYADKYTDVDKNLIPNGKTPSVKGTVFDFTDEHEIGERISDSFEGYDHNYVISVNTHKEFLGKELGLCATVSSNRLKMNVYTDQPCVQFYIGNFLGKGPDFKGGIKQVKHGAFCLETQTEPNCINHGKAFYDNGEIYTHTTVYSIEKI